MITEEKIAKYDTLGIHEGDTNKDHVALLGAIAAYKSLDCHMEMLIERLTEEQVSNLATAMTEIAKLFKELSSKKPMCNSRGAPMGDDNMTDGGNVFPECGCPHAYISEL